MPSGVSQSRRAEAGAMQHLHRSDRAGAKDHFALRASIDDLAAAQEPHAGGPAVLDDEAIGQHMFLDAQIAAAKRGF